VEALLRRAGRSGMTAGASKKLQVGPLVLDPDALSVERDCLFARWGEGITFMLLAGKE
jgi:hypothetical protein